MNTRRKISHLKLLVDGKELKLTFGVDGLHLREKHAREETLVHYERLVRIVRASVANYQDALAQGIDVAAADIRAIADLVESGEVTKPALLEAEEQLKRTLKLMRAKILLMR